MEYTNKQIKRILRINEFIEISGTLAKEYKEFENKEYSIKTFADRERIYRLYCSSIYNLIKAIQESREFFESIPKYQDLEKMLDAKYVAYDKNYCVKDNYESTLFKILETIRHQVNHFTKDDDDNNILFEIYIDFELIETVRNTVNQIFYEVYNTIDKEKIKEIVLSKPKIRYSFDIISNRINDIESRINKSDNPLNEAFREDNEKAFQLFKQLFNRSSLYDLLVKDPKAIEMFDSADKEMKELFKREVEFISKNGTDLEKETYKLIKEFTDKKAGKSIKDTEKNFNILQDKLNELKEKYRKD